MEEFGSEVPLWAVIPFAVMLLGIAILPLVAHRWWESNRNRGLFTAIVASPMAVFLLLEFPEGLVHSGHEYVSFIALLGSLYVIAGGIHVSGDLKATPSTNLAMLAIGAVLANLIGTTGASMLLIRVLLRTNEQRQHVAHIPFFFILLVSNCGGLLTPMGDPPLFLGYLRGVPFTWTLSLWPFWLGAVSYLLAAFYVMDRRAYGREKAKHIALDEAERVPVSAQGLINAPLLLLVIGAIFLPTPWREVVMVGLTLVSVFVGPRPPRVANGFTYGPILEVAILFAGIFVTMVPALALLEARGSELGLTEPWQFFLATGSLSSMLDNAPTYLTFLSTAMGLDLAGAAEMISLNEGAVPETFLIAISTAAVFMGANTYIGNGPNFMVKAISEEVGYSMPSFFGFALRASITLAPIYLAMVVFLILRW
ncbi:MAG TPA: sodium:proton antiporter [Sandaracinaceae bacterium LLY-WYZ-13_1]|nr:sodium:proton antiporter [Sandaracinaceae bacterium LLY-WYZ-13_1]